MSLQGVIRHILREHVELAAFQWSQQRMLSRAHPMDNAAIDHVNARLSANLDAVLIGGEAAWPIILDRFEDFPEEGELFVAAHLAMALGDAERIDQCLWLAHQTPDARTGLADALAQFPPTVSGPTVRRMLRADSAVIRAAALDVLAHHRADAGALLITCLSDPSPILRASAIALAAATGRSDCAAQIADLAEEAAPDLRFAASAALAELGHPTALTLLKAEVEDGAHAEDALRLLRQVLPEADFLSYLGMLYGRAETRALAVRGIGMTGDRDRLGWLIEQMASPAMAIAAGESFLELFPEAAGASGLFTYDGASLGAEFEGESGAFPVASEVSIWAKGGGTRNPH